MRTIGLALAVLMMQACAASDDGGEVAGGGAFGGAGGSSGAGAAGSGGSIIAPDGGCSEDCGDGVCVGGSCCAEDRACGNECCAGTTVCSFGACASPGATCSNSDECGAQEYCELSLGEGGSGAVPAGCSAIPTGKCLLKPQLCASGQAPDPAKGDITCVQSCQLPVAKDPFTLTAKYSWGKYNGETAEPFPYDIRNAPIAIQLDDDDCDGAVTARDIPEIVFTASPYDGATPKNGDIRAISIVGGKVVEKWTIKNGGHPWTYLAAGNIDGLPGNEIVACNGGALVAYSADPTNGKATPKLKWTSAKFPCTVPSIADLDQDGIAEVIVRGGVVRGDTGASKLTLTDGGAPTTLSGYLVVSDIDGDGFLDLVSGSRAFDRTGKVFAKSGIAGNHPAVGDLSSPPDGIPEVVAIDWGTHTVNIWRYKAGAKDNVEVVRSGIDLNTLLDANNCAPSKKGHLHGGGPPTIADVNGDGVADVAVAGGVGYVVLDGKKLLDKSKTNAQVFLWAKDTEDCSSAQTGSTVFDFDGDGKVEVLYGDEERFRIYDGPTGNELFSTCNTNGTILEAPIVADVDNDGQADVVVVSNARYALFCDGTKTSGLRVFGTENGKWTRTRRVWNQHAYHVTNVEEDGTIPTKELPNYKQPGLNNFRQNKQPGLERAGADLVANLAPRCGDKTLQATVFNLGEAPVPAGATVALFEGSAGGGTKLATRTTSVTLYPAQSEKLEFPFSEVPDIASGKSPAYVTVTPPSGSLECRTGNNASSEVTVSCGVR